MGYCKELVRWGAPVLAALAIAAPANSKGAPPTIRQFDVATTEKLGREMYDQDQLAWKATDIALAHFTEDDLKSQKSQGWIVETTPTGNIVRFVRDAGGGPTLFYDVSFASDGSTTSGVPQNTALSPQENVLYSARALALANITHRCSDRYNAITLKDPADDGWLVWVMAATTDPSVIVIGGHYRFTISADGKTILQKDALSNGCLKIPKPDPRQGTPEGIFTGEFVSLMPLETYVFSSLSHKIPISVGTLDGKVWKIDGDRISNIDMNTPGVEGVMARTIAAKTEHCMTISTKTDETPPKYYTGTIPSVLEATEKNPKFAIEDAFGMHTISIICGRMDIVPAPNDYKVVVAGYTLEIMDTGAGHSRRIADLTFIDGKFEFHLKKGDVLTDEQNSRLNARLDAFRNAPPKNQ